MSRVTNVITLRLSSLASDRELVELITGVLH